MLQSVENNILRFISFNIHKPPYGSHDNVLIFFLILLHSTVVVYFHKPPYGPDDNVLNFF